MTAIINEAGLEERERQALVATECAQLRAELANLRAELDQRRRADFEAIMEAVTACSNDLIDQVKALTAKLFDKIDSTFAALRVRADGDTKSAFRVARERADEVSELPNPLPPRVIN
jgi:hypothetical protein